MFVDEVVELVLPPLPPPPPVSESSTAVPGTSSVIGLSPRATAGTSAMRTSAAAAGTSRLPNEPDMSSPQIEMDFPYGSTPPHGCGTNANCGTSRNEKLRRNFTSNFGESHAIERSVEYAVRDCPVSHASARRGPLLARELCARQVDRC